MCEQVTTFLYDNKNNKYVYKKIMVVSVQFIGDKMKSVPLSWLVMFKIKERGS